MKKLNITKEQFNKSQFLQKKYGKLEFVSESGKYFKTSKGKVLKFNESIHTRLDNGPTIPQTEQEETLCNYIAQEIEEKFGVHCFCNSQNPGEEMHIEVYVSFPDDAQPNSKEYEDIIEDLEKLVDAIGAQENEGERWGDSSFTWNNDEEIFGEVWPIDGQDKEMINEKLDYVGSSDKSVTLSNDCPFCGKHYEFTLDMDFDKWMDCMWKWKDGQTIQNAFPDLSPDEREQIKTGICQKCWNSLGDEGDEEDEEVVNEGGKMATIEDFDPTEPEGEFVLTLADQEGNTEEQNFYMDVDEYWGNVNNNAGCFYPGEPGEEEFFDGVGYGNDEDGYLKVVKVVSDRGEMTPEDFGNLCDQYVDWFSA